MTHDHTEGLRRWMLDDNVPAKDLAKNTGETWTTMQLIEAFEVLSFLAPFVLVRRYSDGAEGTLEFTPSPRVYFNWVPK